MLNMKLLWWLSGKESACNAGDSVGSLDLDDFLEEGMATHSVFLPGKSHEGYVSGPRIVSNSA